MLRTKIVCTIGPASEKKEILLQLVKTGLNVARLNFSHGDHQEHGRRIQRLKEIEAQTGQTIGILLDTTGPEIRTGSLREDPVKLVQGEEIILSTKKVVGNSSRISVTYQGLTGDVENGTRVLIDDGLIELEVVEVSDHEIRCRIINGGMLGSRKGVNIPGVSINLPALTDKDREDIRFGIRQGIHFIAASFVRRAENIDEIRKLLQDEDAEGIYIIAKIENQEAVDNIDEIIGAADGIMIARGDLGVEIAPERVPVIQKSIINKCNRAAKPVITATQMLDSMIRNPRPTRAEASDVANAIYDGTDAIMLSGESAIGDYPVEAVRTMTRIAKEIEASTSYREKLLSYKVPSSHSVTDAISLAACQTAIDLKVSSIVCSTSSGLTARMVSKYRPLIPIVGATHNEMVKNILTLVWGVFPLKVPESSSTDEMIHNAIVGLVKKELAQKGDLVTITAGVPVGRSGTTNLIEVLTIGDN